MDRGVMIPPEKDKQRDGNTCTNYTKLTIVIYRYYQVYRSVLSIQVRFIFCQCVLFQKAILLFSNNNIPVLVNSMHIWMGVTYLFGIESHIICLIGIVSLISAWILRMLYQGFYYLNDFLLIFYLVLFGLLWCWICSTWDLSLEKKLRTFNIVKKQIYKTHFIIFL